MPKLPERILFVIGSLDLGGAEAQMTALAVGLKARDMNVQAFCLHAGGPLYSRLADAGVPVIDGGYAVHSALWRRLLSVAWAGSRLLFTCIVWRPTVVQGFLPLTNVMAAAAGWLSWRPLVFTARRSLGTYQDRNPGWRPLDRLANRLSHAVIANSEAVAADAARRDCIDSRKLCIIPNGIDFDRMATTKPRELIRKEMGLRQGDLGIICVANLIPYKGHGDLLEAFGTIASAFPRSHLFLAGEDRGLGLALRQGAERLGITHRVTFLGLRTDIPDILCAMDVGVVSSHEEGLSNALLELLAAGLPIVATDVGGNREALDGMEGCRLVPPRDPEALAHAVTDILSGLDADRALAPTRRGRVKSRYALSSMIDAYLALYSGKRPDSRGPS